MRPTVRRLDARGCVRQLGPGGAGMRGYAGVIRLERWCELDRRNDATTGVSRSETPWPLRTYWLISRHKRSGLEVLTADIDGEGACLPVFGFEEEAGMFLWFATAEDGWQVRETSAGELVSVLHGLSECVRRVALDPLPRVCAGATPASLLLPRKDFGRAILNQRRPGPQRGVVRAVS